MSRRSITYHPGSNNLRVFREALKHDLLQLQSRGTRSKTRSIGNSMSWSTITDHPGTTNLRVFHKAVKHDPLQMHCRGDPSRIIRVLPNSGYSNKLKNTIYCKSNVAEQWFELIQGIPACSKPRCSVNALLWCNDSNCRGYTKKLDDTIPLKMNVLEQLLKLSQVIVDAVHSWSLLI